MITKEDGLSDQEIQELASNLPGCAPACLTCVNSRVFGTRCAIQSVTVHRNRWPDGSEPQKLKNLLLKRPDGCPIK